MTGDLLKCNVLATHTIANVSETLARKLELPERYRSIGILTADSDDVTYCALDEAGRTIMKGAYDHMGLTARSYDRILRVARTIADLDGEARIAAHHLAEAIQYRESEYFQR